MMSKAVWVISFKLGKNVSSEDFLQATQRLHDEVVSKANGFISWEQFCDGDTWTDFVTWETIEDANNGTKVGQGHHDAEEFYAMIQMKTCKMLISSLVKSY